MILGIDHLDLIKGKPQILLGFQQFLLDGKLDEYHKVKLFHLCVRSREDVRYNALETHRLIATLAHADIMLITSLCDGMNLVSFEYVALQIKRKGVLIISEFAGTAEFLSGAIKINPNNVFEVASAITQALEMSYEERARRHAENFRYVSAHTSQRWAENLLRLLMQSPQDGGKLIRAPSDDGDRAPPDGIESLRHRNEREKKKRRKRKRKKCDFSFLHQNVLLFFIFFLFLYFDK